MIYKHTKSGELYRYVLKYWDVERQATYTLYVSLKDGVFFGRNAEAFAKNFEPVEDTQGKITARPHPFIADPVTP